MTLWLIDCAVFFFTDTASTEIYTLSLHDALPISGRIQRPTARVQCRISRLPPQVGPVTARLGWCHTGRSPGRPGRSEEHTSELQSHSDLVCRLLLEKKNHHIHNRTP